MPDYALVLDGEEIGIDFDETVEQFEEHGHGRGNPVATDPMEDDALH